MANAVKVDEVTGPPPATMTSRWSRWRAVVAGFFPVTEPSKTPRVRMAVWYLAAFAAAVGYLLLIPAGRSRLQHMWAEDGARFFLDANTTPLWKVLIEPYADSGYLHTVPRLGAELASQLPLSWAAASVAITAAALRAGVALLVFTASGSVLRSTTLRVALAALVVVAPVGNSEAVNNLANFHWFALFGAFWLLWWRPALRWQIALAAVSLFLAATSSALVLLLSPLALARFALPGWRQRIITLAFFLGVVIQSSVMVLSPRYDHFNQPVDAKAAAMAALSRVPLVTFTGSEDVARFYVAFGYWPFVGALVFILALAVVAFRWGGAPRAVLVALALGYAAVSIWLSLSQNWHWGAGILQPGVVLDGQRYSVVPCLLLLAVVAIGLDRIPKAGWRRIGMAAVAAVLLTAIVRQLPESTGRLTGVTWQQTVATAKLECAQGKPAAVLQLAPTVPDNWTVKLACQYVH
jgi:hypothetical protein